MSAAELKKQITINLDKMDTEQLKAAWRLVKEISLKQEVVKIDEERLQKSLKIGLAELDKGEGTNFRNFLNEMQEKYGQK